MRNRSQGKNIGVKSVIIRCNDNDKSNTKERTIMIILKVVIIMITNKVIMKMIIRPAFNTSCLV